MIFDIKQEDFHQKARLVAGGHTTPAPEMITYASVVSRESVRIALLLAALNNVEVKTADIENAYTQLPMRKRFTRSLDLSLARMQGRRRLWLDHYMAWKVQARHFAIILLIVCDI